MRASRSEWRKRRAAGARSVILCYKCLSTSISVSVQLGLFHNLQTPVQYIEYNRSVTLVQKLTNKKSILVLTVGQMCVTIISHRKDCNAQVGVNGKNSRIRSRLHDCVTVIVD